LALVSEFLQDTEIHRIRSEAADIKAKVGVKNLTPASVQSFINSGGFA
jgi:trimethylamine:corrinoid methyltransferase-like protein